MKTKFFSTFLLVAVLMTFVGCSGSDNEQQASPSAEPQGTEATAPTDGEAQTEPQETTQTTTKEITNISLVLAGGLGDRSFYDSSFTAVERTKRDFDIEYKVFECRNNPSVYTEQLVQASEFSNVVAVVGFEFFDVIQEVAVEFPDVTYIYVDNDIPGYDNIISVIYKENEGAFLAGAFAAIMTTKTDIEGIDDNAIIGMVGGMDIPVIRNFRVGYEAGAKYINPDITVEVTFAEDFEDPAKGKEAATTLYSRGADIVFTAAGKTGEGVFEAGREQGKFAIGVDTDQRYINPDVIMASAIKEVGNSIYDVIVEIREDTLEPGSLVVYGLEQGGVDLAYGTEDMTQFADEQTLQTIQEIKEKIMSGEIVVPTNES